MLEEVRRYTARPGTIVTVVLPELVVSHWWEQLLHSQSALFFKRLLLFEPGVVVTSVPLHVSRVAEDAPPRPRTRRHELDGRRRCPASLRRPGTPRACR